MATQMSTFMTSQSASSTAGTLPVATTAPTADSPKASSDGFEIWSRKQEGEDFRDVESVAGDSQYNYVTGDEV